ncbi:MAG TPA: branched-chain amino acid ABC transporter permease [Bacillota bacterium]|nr:branched-chain amino acid ABC transporter permease [Bacillota bacterium]
MKYLLVAAASLVFAALPFVLKNNYLLSILIVIGIYTLVVEGLGVLMGYAGQVSFGQAAFFGIGGYTVAILTTRFHCETVPALLAAMVLPALTAAVIGKPTLKLREHYLALATLAFGLLVHVFFNEGRELTGGPSGLTGIPYLNAGGFIFNRDYEFYYLVWSLVLLVFLGVRNLDRSRIGRSLRAIRDSEVAAEANGINCSSLKLQAFVFSALLAGLGGGIYAYYVTFISPAPFGFNMSIQFVLMAVIGGLGTVWGPVLGTGLVVVLGEVLRWFIPLILPRAGGEYQIIFFGIILVLAMIFKPEGLGAGWRRKVRANETETAEAVSLNASVNTCSSGR